MQWGPSQQRNSNQDQQHATQMSRRTGGRTLPLLHQPRQLPGTDQLR